MTGRKSSQKSRALPKAKRPTPQGLSFLLEIGTEELPSQFFPGVLEDFENMGRQLLADCRLAFREVRVLGTPRRLVLLAAGVEPKQSPLLQEVFGPPKSAAFDAEGHPTKAAEGFAKSQGVPVESLTVKETPKGLYVCVEKHQKGQPAKRVLAEALPSMLAKMNFPKAMRWNASRARFARPVRWLVAMVGPEVIRFEFAGIRSGDATLAHRFLRTKARASGRPLTVTDASRYLEVMSKAGVVVDPHERRKLIQEQVNRLAKAAGGQPEPGTYQELIEQAVYGVESPKAIMGAFDRDFLAVPKPVLISSMKEHQGFFSLIVPDGRLLPKFIAVTNMPWGDVKLMTKGNERVLAARLKDAQHFFREDVKRPLHERVPDLEQVVFHGKLGTIRQKVDRIQALVGWVAEQVGRPDLKGVCERAAFLSKADLTTGMVGEFPTLQGVMGEAYAEHAQEPSAVCRAIGSQYYPRFPEDGLPDNLPGVLLGLVDRCDSIISFFSVGMVPTGSEDPLGLRRAAYGMVRLMTETPLRLNMVHMIRRNLELLGGQGIDPKTGTTVQDSLNFIVDRLRFFGRQTLNLRDDVMEAVTAGRNADHCDVFDLFVRMQALQSITQQADFEPLMTGFKRAHRIVEKEGWTAVGVNPDLFSHESEAAVYRMMEQVQRIVHEAMAGQQYEKALQALLELKTPIDHFFGSVLVNDGNADIRANRLSLLTVIDRLFLQVADFSCIQSMG